ncbi:MAG: 7-cyano-7-deazaguanine synthase [Pirellulales bacterium]
MPTAAMNSTTGLLLSGGIDSAVLLWQLQQTADQVAPFYIRTGCVWQNEELAAVNQFLAATAFPNVGTLVELEMPLADLYGRHWSITGSRVPDDQTADEAVYLPGRNPLLLLKPALWCYRHNIRQLALATLAANPFRDATPRFFQAFETMLREADCGSVAIIRPFEALTKKDVLALGRHVPLELTFSCLSPIEGQHCGRCNKCAERRRGFAETGIEDRTRYYAGPAATPSTMR